MPSEIKIKIRFDSGEAVKGLKGLEATSSQALRAVAANAKGAAVATRDHAKAQELAAAASVSSAKAAQFAAQTTLAESRARKASAQANLEDARTRTINEKAINAETDALRKKAQADALFKTKGRGESRRALVEGASNGLIGAGGIGVALSVTNLQQAAGYDQALRNVSSLTKATGTQFQKMHDDVLSLTRDPLIRQSPEDLAKGLYDIASSGKSGREALDILRASAVAAGAGMSDTATASRVLMAVLNSGIGGVKSAAQAADVLFQEINLGVNSFEDLANGIGPVLPIAAKAGVSLQEVAAALAVMTRQGVSLSEGSTQLVQVLTHLIGPPASAAKEMDKLGIAHGLTAVKAEGLTGAIQNVIRATHGHEDSLQRIFPRVESFTGLLAIAKGDGHDYSEMLDGMTHASDGVGAAHGAAAEQAKGAMAQADKLEQKYKTLAITTGEKLLPVAERLADDLGGLLDKFGKLPKPVQDCTTDMIAYGGALMVAAGGAGKLFLALKGAKTLLIGAGAAGAAEGAGGGFAAGGLLGLSRMALTGGGLPGLLGRVMGGDAAGTWLPASAGGNLGGFTLGSGLLGGAALASPAIFGGAMLRAIWGEQIDQGNQTGRGLETTDLSPFVSRMAAIRKAHPKDYADRPDYLAADAQFRQMGGGNARNGVNGVVGANVAPGSSVGDKIAQEAWKRQLDGSARTFVHHCEGLAHATYNSVTGAYSKVLDHSGGSAKSALAKFQALGLAKPYTPGMALPPGSLLYSTSLGAKGSSEGKFGHVQTIGPQGQRLDQYGVNHFAPRNFQWYVPPPGAGAGKPGKAGGGSPGGDLDDKTKDAQAQDRAEAMVERAGASQDAAQSAFDHCKKEYDRTKNPAFIVLARAALVKLTAAKMASAKATLQKAIDQAHHSGTNAEGAKAAFARTKSSVGRDASEASQGLDDMQLGTPAERQRRVRDAQIARQRNLLAATDGAIGAYETALGKGVVSDYRPLLDAYGKRESRQKDLAGMEFRQGLADSPGDRDRLLAERRGKEADAHRKAVEDTAAAQNTYNGAVAKGLQLELARLQAQRQGLDLTLQSAKTDDERKAARQAVFENQKQQLLKTRAIDALSDDPTTKAMAGLNYTVGLQAAQADRYAGDRQDADTDRDRHISFLRAEAEATDDLTERKNILMRAQQREADVAQETGSKDVIAQTRLQHNAETRALDREIAHRQAEAGLSALLLGKAHGPGDGEAVLKPYADLAATGTLEQQKQAVQQYLDVLQALFSAHALSRQQALSDIDRLTAALKGQGLSDSQTAQAVVAARQGVRTDERGGTRSDQQRARVQAQAQALLDNLTGAAGQASGDFVRSLLSGKGTKGAVRGLVSDLEGAAEGALSQTISQGIADSLKNALRGGAGKEIWSSISSVFDGAKGSLLQGAAAVYGAAMALGAGGKKKQKHSILGGILGFAAGSLLPGVGNLEGAEFGAALGGAFAGGGRPPVGKLSVVGEKGWEAFVPDAPGTVLSHDDAMAALSTRVAVPVPVPGPPRMGRPFHTDTMGMSTMQRTLERLHEHLTRNPGGDEITIHGGVHNQADEDRVSSILASKKERGARSLTPA